MNLAPSPPAYDTTDQDQMRGTLEQEDKRNLKVGAPVIITASDSSRWKLVVSTAGALSTVAA